MPRQNLAWLLGVAAFTALGLAVVYSGPVPAKEKDKNYELVRLLVDVLDEVDHKYVNKLDDERKRRLVEDMINGGLDRLDPHSSFINAKEFKQFTKQSKGKFGGIGVQIGYDRGSGMQLQVITPMVGTPAYEAGILANDLIIKIDGKSTESMRLNEAVDLIQGDPGQQVVLTVLHEGSKEPQDVKIVRAEIEVQSVLGDLRKSDNPKDWEFFIDKPNKIAYLRMVAFTETTAADLRKDLEQLKKEGVKGLVIDLRGNPGGLLKAAVEVSNMFIVEGRIVSTKGRNHKEEVYDAEADKVILPPGECAVAVLVNRSSASASEILSAALQDHQRAVVVGERSYGKGSVQNIIPMEGNASALKLTTASYWRPSGKNIHRFPDSKEADDWGVKPNEGFEVTLKDDERIAYAVYRRDRDIVH
ncbi:MAG TPA: S41 family peptidase, partial [Gemmataceae bacterium]|nr:S41 family peptidase [Gemmataceae bacterium]